METVGYNRETKETGIETRGAESRARGGTAVAGTARLPEWTFTGATERFYRSRRGIYFRNGCSAVKSTNSWICWDGINLSIHRKVPRSTGVRRKMRKGFRSGWSPRDLPLSQNYSSLFFTFLCPSWRISKTTRPRISRITCKSIGYEKSSTTRWSNRNLSAMTAIDLGAGVNAQSQ